MEINWVIYLCVCVWHDNWLTSQWNTQCKIPQMSIFFWYYFILWHIKKLFLMTLNIKIFYRNFLIYMREWKIKLCTSLLLLLFFLIMKLYFIWHFFLFFSSHVTLLSMLACLLLHIHLTNNQNNHTCCLWTDGCYRRYKRWLLRNKQTFIFIWI